MNELRLAWSCAAIQPTIRAARAPHISDVLTVTASSILVVVARVKYHGTLRALGGSTWSQLIDASASALGQQHVFAVTGEHVCFSPDRGRNEAGSTTSVPSQIPKDVAGAPWTLFEPRSVIFSLGNLDPPRPDCLAHPIRHAPFREILFNAIVRNSTRTSPSTRPVAPP
jgi:hypothetical protein